MTEAATFCTPSTTREALIKHFRLPANTTEDGVDAAIVRSLCAKYGLEETATVEEIEARMHEVRCARFGLDPATTTEATLDAHVDALIATKIAA